MQFTHKAAPLLGLAALAALGLTVRPASAQTTGFVNNPTSNSSDFSNFITSHGGTIDSNVNFDTEGAGPNNPTFYTTSDGITITGAGTFSTIINGTGPSEYNNFTSPLSSGEGSHAASPYLYADTTSPASLTLSFTAPVVGVGLDTIDLFNPNTTSDTLILTAYSGIDGTGTTLGSYTDANYNFQKNNLYFMGVATSDGSAGIGSVILSRTNDSSNDSIGIDNILIGRNSPNLTSTPEPSSVASLGIGAAGLLGLMLRARKRRTA